MRRYANKIIRDSNDLCRWLYRPQVVVDGNMQLVHIRNKRADDDVSLSDGKAFMVERAPYARHIASAPDKQPVCVSSTIINAIYLT